MFSSIVRLCVTVVACLCLSVPSWAQSIWKWRDAKGQLQLSDRPPPPDIPDSAIVQRPGGARQPQPQRQVETPVPGSAPSASAASAAASAPKRETELEARKRKLQQEQEARKKAEQEQAQARAQAKRAEFCGQLRNNMAAIDSGQRLSRFNSKGEREVLDDSARAEEAARLRRELAENCQP